MKGVRKRRIFLWAMGLVVLVWSCGGGGSSPTAPPGFEVLEAQAKCGTPPCGGGGGNTGGGGKSADEIVWTIYASGSLTSAPQVRNVVPANSMTFDTFPFANGNSELEQLATLSAAQYPGFSTCFADTGYTADDLVVEEDSKTGEIHAVYRFGAMRLDGSRAITYEIVFHALGPPGTTWPPGVGDTTLSTDQFEVRGVAQKNNTCNGSGTLPNGSVTFHLTGAAP